LVGKLQKQLITDQGWQRLASGIELDSSGLIKPTFYGDMPNLSCTQRLAIHVTEPNSETKFYSTLATLREHTYCDDLGCENKDSSLVSSIPAELEQLIYSKQKPNFGNLLKIDRAYVRASNFVKGRPNEFTVYAFPSNSAVRFIESGPKLEMHFEQKCN
jgi:hypothetical protein